MIIGVMAPSPNPMSDAVRVKELAREAGFPLVGIARVAGADVGVRYREWLDRGYAGEMSYLGRHVEHRRDPALLIEDVRSVIALGVPYKTHDQMSEMPSGTGRISNYAWGDDYHLVIQERLERLGQLLVGAFPSYTGRGFVDTAPILEREWAARAGLGWIGKHTLLIHQFYGSYVFLAEILTTLELAPDIPVTDHCGSCTACLDACPTAAFPEAGVLDASRCVSYLTIEHRGPLPDSLNSQLGEWVYGCDICQLVCPWNRKSPSTLDPAFQPRHHWIAPSLSTLSTLDEATWIAWTRRSAIKRTKLAGLQRNAQVALEKRPDSG